MFNKCKTIPKAGHQTWKLEMASSYTSDHSFHNIEQTKLKFTELTHLSNGATSWETLGLDLKQKITNMVLYSESKNNSTCHFFTHYMKLTKQKWIEIYFIPNTKRQHRMQIKMTLRVSFVIVADTQLNCCIYWYQND